MGEEALPARRRGRRKRREKEAIKEAAADLERLKLGPDGDFGPGLVFAS